MLSSTSNSSKKTMSRFTCTELDSGNHTFEIDGYSLLRGSGVGTYFRSDTFTVGGFDWEIYFYPDGIEHEEYVVALLQLVSTNSKTPARYVLRFVNHSHQTKMQTKLSFPMQIHTWPGIAAAESAQGTGLFKSCNGSCDGDGTRFGLHMLRSQLEGHNNLSCYIVNDRLTIQCDLTVIGVGHSKMFQNRVEPKIEVPPSDMAEQFGNLLTQKKGADVKFLVGEETFEAHKIVLAARSPVFWEKFLGQSQAGTFYVTVDNVQPAVFGAMLHFIYNDSLPDMGDLEGKDYDDMMWRLISAAHRHGMDRLRLVCQSNICNNLDVETVATTLRLADQYKCGEIKDACIEFIASSENKDSVAATEGYADLKLMCPSVFIDLYERTSKLQKT